MHVASGRNPFSLNKIEIDIVTNVFHKSDFGLKSLNYLFSVQFLFWFMLAGQTLGQFRQGLDCKNPIKTLSRWKASFIT